MSIQKVARFNKTFIIDEKEVEVEFHPVNVVVKKLYQVYIPLGGKLLRIHMQKESNGQFIMANKDQLPQNIIDMESAFGSAIINA